MCYFLWGNAARFPHYLRRIFSCGLLSSLSLVAEATRCLCYWSHGFEEIHTRFKRGIMAGGTPQPCPWADALYKLCRTRSTWYFSKFFSVLFSIERKSFIPLLWYGGAILAILENTPLLTVWLTKLTCELCNCTHECNQPTTGINVERYPNSN